MEESIQLQSDSTASRVAGNLWMGGCPPVNCPVEERFDCLVLCAKEYQLPEFFHLETIQAPLQDDGLPMRAGEAEMAVRAAGAVIRVLRGGGSALVTCYSGLNRSGLVCALALCKGGGVEPDSAVSLIRAARGERSFRNRYFDSFLRAYCSA